MADYLPHTDEEISVMLGFLGLASLDELFAAVPSALRLSAGLDLEEGRFEPDVFDDMDRLARRNLGSTDRLVCFAGAGAYDHEVPPVTRALAGRSEFMTAYTPYQPEVAQGVLQAVFEYQTMVARLAGLPIANASLYDGASALVEAVNLGVAASGRRSVWISGGLHPHWRQVLRTLSAGTGHNLVDVTLSEGITQWPMPDVESGGYGQEPPGVVVVAYPNVLGCLEDLAVVRRLCDETGAVMVVAADPIAAGIVRSGGAWGADVVIGEGQALGTPLSFGGPYLGLFACQQSHVRRLPGRLVGETVDTKGTRAYVTTLRAREQDIRREKATSNVCTNQTLMAVTAAIQLGWLGTAGLAEVARRGAAATHYCRRSLLSLDGLGSVTGSMPVVREFAVRCPLPAATMVDRLAEEGFLGGVALSALGLGVETTVSEQDVTHGLLVAVTERRTRQEIDAYVATFEKVMR